MRLLRSREDRSRHGHLPALQNICTLKTAPGPLEDLCLRSFVRSLFGSLSPGGSNLHFKMAFPFSAPGAAQCDGASMSLPALRRGAEGRVTQRPGLPATHSQDRAPNVPSSALPCAQGAPISSLFQL